MGIVAGLVMGKPLGITLLVFIAVLLGVCRLPLDMNWKHVFGAGLLGDIGFTMSIFITNLAFTGEAELINSSKIAILLASVTAGTMGFVWLKMFGKPHGQNSTKHSKLLRKNIKKLPDSHFGIFSLLKN
jgi:NhaA family Na+:H+ antiporter